MLNKLLVTIRQYRMVAPGDHIICGVSGGADSVALLYAMYLLRDKLGITLSAAHFNHNLRPGEAQRDQAFVQALCDRYEIRLYLGSGEVTPGKRGLEAAARDARYRFFDSLPGKIATAHTADDNAETVLMHMVRGTGLKGMGGIAPVRDRFIRPMLEVTRRDVLAFLAENYLEYVEDSTNETDFCLRNRLRHHVMPLLREENPRLAENLSAMALRLRLDEDCLGALAGAGSPRDVETLRQMHPALRARALESFLKESGVREPEAQHIALAQALVFSDKPSASAEFPGGVTVSRQYDRLIAGRIPEPLDRVELHCPGVTQVGAYRIRCEQASDLTQSAGSFVVCPKGTLYLRSREPGDAIRLSGGKKSLKKLFIDRKIPAALRGQVPVIGDDLGILGVYEIGVDLDRAAQSLPAVRIFIERL